MAYDVSATPLRRMFPQFFAMIVPFYRAGKAAFCLLEIAGIPGLGDVRSLLQASFNVYAMLARF